LRPKTIDARDINTPPSPTTGSQDTQQNEQDDNMSDNGRFGASDDSELAQWEVLRIEADEGDNYIDPFYGGEDDDASVLNDNNNAPAISLQISSASCWKTFEHTRTMHNSILSHLPTISDPVSS
jgi:hypothetical protein